MFRTAGILALAIAQIAVPAVAQITEPATAEHAVDATATDAFAGIETLAETDLSAIAGREDSGTLIASATQRNTVSNNSVIGQSTTGAVQIDGNAFQNLQGLAVISANSGNNVAINSAMNVTINLGGPQ
ncbi:MAG: hypothetical protein ACKVOP_08075 [Sphingomonadaceae bacterium]